MKRKLNIVPKNKTCRCGKKIKHHHKLCDDCWREEQKDKKILRKAYRELKGPTKGILKKECHDKIIEAHLVTPWGIKDGRFWKCKECGTWLTSDPFHIALNKNPTMFDNLSIEETIKRATHAAVEEELQKEKEK